jgi:hypothetical protein
VLRYLVSALAISAALVGCSAAAVSPETPAPPAASAGAPTGTVGQPVTVTWDDGSGTVTVNAITRFKPEYGTTDNPAGHLALDVTYTVSTGKASYNPLYWSARDAAGHEYGTAMGPEPWLKSGELVVGETVRGWIAFDAPGGPLTVFLDGPLAGHLATWSVAA